MIRKLRMKFVWISLASLVLVISLLMGLINVVNYQRMIENADEVLDILADNNGSFPKPEGEDEEPGAGKNPGKEPASEQESGADSVTDAAVSEKKTETGTTQLTEVGAEESVTETGQKTEASAQEETTETGTKTAAGNASQEESDAADDETQGKNMDEAQGAAPDEKQDPGAEKDSGKKPKNQRQLSPETPYETRFFLAQIDENGEVLFTDTTMIAAVDDAAAVSYVQSVWDNGKERGFADGYRYRKKQDGSQTLVIFLDCNRNLNSFRSTLVTTVGVSAFGILLVFALIWFFSGIVVKPVYESYEKQKRFITDAGHEIKTPLTIIDADIDVLSMDIGENEWLEDMQKQTERLSGLTTELIYLARMEEDSHQLQRIDLPFSDLVEETAQSFQSLAIVQNKTFELEIQPMIMLSGEEKSLRKLVSILLDNALKYSEEQGAIRVKLEQNGRQVKLMVENTTESITKENLEHLFERFYRGDPSRSSRQSGYGIGLSVAEAIVQAHKGEIRATSKDGRSLLITVTLPAALGAQAGGRSS